MTPSEPSEPVGATSCLTPRNVDNIHGDGPARYWRRPRSTVQKVRNALVANRSVF